MTITDETGTGKYQVTYIPPTGVYTPTSAGLQFTLQIIAVDEDGTADTGAISFFVVPSDITIADTSSILEKVRRRTGITQDVFIHLKPGDEDVDLGGGGVYELPFVAKNGTAMSLGSGATQYSWLTYRSYLTLNTPANDGDEMFVQVQRVFSNEAINDIIEESQDMVVMPALKALYEVSDLATSPTVQALIAARTSGRLREDMSKGGTLEDPKYRSGWELINEVKEILAAIKAGSMGLSAEDGTEIPTKSGAFVGGFINPAGVIDGRLKMIDQAQRWVGTIRSYWPEVAPENVVDLRRLA